MNVYNPKVSNLSFMVEIKKAIKEINEYSDLTITNPTSKKKKAIHKGTSEILSIHFTIVWDKNKNYTKSKKTNDNINDVFTDTATVSKTFDEYIDEKVEKAYQGAIEKGTPIKSTPEAFKNGIRNNLLKDGAESQYEIIMYLENEKNKLKSKITDNQPYMIIFRTFENESKPFYINDKFQFIRTVPDDNNNILVTHNADETLQAIDDNLGEYYLDLQRCDYSKEYDVGRL